MQAQALNNEHVSNIINNLKTARADGIATLPHIPQEVEEYYSTFDIFIKNQHKNHIKKKKNRKKR